nr:developmentally-regulated G-protein 2 [Ipomoea batatas]
MPFASTSDLGLSFLRRRLLLHRENSSIAIFVESSPQPRRNATTQSCHQPGTPRLPGVATSHADSPTRRSVVVDSRSASDAIAAAAAFVTKISTSALQSSDIFRFFSFICDGTCLLDLKIYFKKKKTGEILFNSTIPLTHVDEKLCYQILHEYKIHNAEVLFREDATVDGLIDVIEGNCKYMKCVYVYNKIDVIAKLCRKKN